MSVEVIIQSLVTLVAVWLAYCFACKQMALQNRIQSNQDIKRRQAEALQTAWSLLGYLSLTESENSLIHWKKSGSGNTAQTTYYLHPEKAQHFIQHTLPSTFYQQAAGLYWPPEIRDAFFEYRTLIYGILLKNSDTPNTTEPILIENENLPEKIKTLYDQLNQTLKQGLQTLETLPP